MIEARYMDDATRAQELIGNDVYGRDGDKLGRVGHVYVDDATHHPEWVTVRTGLFGMRESFVPLAGASTHEHRIDLDVSGERVKEAPRVEAEHGHLSEQEGRDLYSYYGIERPTTGAPQPVSARQQAEGPTPGRNPAGRAIEVVATETGRHHRSESAPEDRRLIPRPDRTQQGKHRKEQ
ncbi:PRC-barrel domain-containing protein [Haloactinomyces albus]|uniref:Sporulation protein YlmC with PRC-barrel domain n=1 Tax=Haloactinomyces albus TaxID=1352928 RepID=A0AAE3ZAR8_9ACTN|nr:PRC-barrel domain-containing protein [Haloactinomyces albus]MDR7301457.1 sporulation protein YlmC with PRC-barrel domain [Haloactinomyces albus]